MDNTYISIGNEIKSILKAEGREIDEKEKPNRQSAVTQVSGNRKPQRGKPKTVWDKDFWRIGATQELLALKKDMRRLGRRYKQATKQHELRGNPTQPKKPRKKVEQQI